jgi:hypothetical protein
VPLHVHWPFSQSQKPQPPGRGHSTDDWQPGRGVHATPPLLEPELLLPPLLEPELLLPPPLELVLPLLELLLPPSPGCPGPLLVLPPQAAATPRRPRTKSRGARIPTLLSEARATGKRR